MSACDICGGTGRLYAHNSHFLADGFYRLRCGICGGGRESSFRDTEYARFQHNARAVIALWNGQKPPPGADIDEALEIMNATKRVTAPRGKEPGK